MSCFVKSTTPPNITPLDPNKHVNFSLGMVLGVDDLSQEFAYHDGHLHWQARDVLGYGTAAGLKIGKDNPEGGTGWRLSVSPGTALTAKGQMVVVDDTYCASLGPWLHDHQGDRDAVLPGEGSSEGGVSLYLTLDYRPCLTDDLPVPGEPCRTEDAVTAPSRVKDGFCLQLSWQMPDQREENAVRDFVEWLRAIRVRQGGPGEGYSLQVFEDAVRSAVNPDLISSDFMLGEPSHELYIPEANACEFLESAFRIWTTELRPKWLNQGAALGAGSQVDPPFPHPPSSGAILLAEVSFPVRRGVVSSEWTAVIQPDGSDLVIDESARPELLHLRMLQEWMTCGRSSTIVPGDTVKEECAFDLNSSAGVDEHYSRADHTHGTPALPELVGDVGGPITNNTLKAIQKTLVVASAPDLVNDEGKALTLVKVSSEDGDSLVWMPANPYGDVQGTLTANVLSNIQTTPVSADPRAIDLSPGAALTLVNVEEGEQSHLEWQPMFPKGDVNGELTNNKLNAIRGTPVNGVAPLTIPQDTGKVLTLVEVPASTDAPAHLEWKPANPKGDVTGNLPQTVLSAIQTTPVSADPKQMDLSAGDALTLVKVGEGNKQHLEWQPAELNGDVTKKLTGNNLAAIQGTLVNASAADVKLEVGQVLTLVKGDLGLVWQPAKPAPATSTTTSVGMKGDVTGASAQNTVEGIWSTPIKKPDPGVDKGNALIYMVDHWELGTTGTTQQPGNFVETPGVGAYRIVAAGAVKVFFSSAGGNNVMVNSSYNRIDIGPGGISYRRFSLTFSDFDKRIGNGENLIVKALPRCSFETPFTVFIGDMKAGSGIEFMVFSLVKSDLIEGEIHIEISSFDHQG